MSYLIVNLTEEIQYKDFFFMFFVFLFTLISFRGDWINLIGRFRFIIQLFFGGVSLLFRI